MLRTAVVIVALLPALASAQPVKEVVDYDQEREEFSEFWERALKPNRELYGQLVAQARALSFESGKQAHQRARRLLSDAIRLAPDRPDAYWELGLLHKRHREWKECAKALGRLFKTAPGFKPKGNSGWAFDVELGTCNAQAGRYRTAIRHFKRILARGQSRQLVHRLIGESFMAIGELGRAVEYLETARRIEGRSALTSNFALAVAYDRDERHSKAREHLDLVIKRDYSLSRTASRTDFIPAADRYYYLGLGYRRRNPAWALIYFRHYLDEIPNRSPWRSRAKAHASELHQELRKQLPLKITGSASLDDKTVRRALRPHLAKLEQCVAEAPELLLRIKIKRVAQKPGPGSPIPGITVLVDYAFRVDTATVEKVVSCVDQVAAGIDLPRLKGAPGSYITVELPVLALGK
ncbi:MAG: tetratricopeptide repeat protein [Deltaproteobacteria bacterium]|jgi:tetratricopeptide (TPR) repeat protein|nr:tetratricopeptide repeat protein [Deltaproteobacteria bacterium]